LNPVNVVNTYLKIVHKENDHANTVIEEGAGGGLKQDAQRGRPRFQS